MQVYFTLSNFPVAAYVVTAITKQDRKIPFVFNTKKDASFAEATNGIRGNFTIASYIAKSAKATDLVGESGSLLEAQIQQWVEFASSELRVTQFEQLEAALQRLNWILQIKTYLIGYKLTLADLAVYEALRGNREWKRCLIQYKQELKHVIRYYTHLDNLPVIANNLKILTEATKKKTSTVEIILSKENVKANIDYKSNIAHEQGGGMDVNLPNAKIGEVVTRFPPEASGYLHIGHAKAALLNNYIARRYGGKLLLRFDDTNPSKEKMEYEHAIEDDLYNLLKIKPDAKSYSSDHFDKCIEYIEKLLREGKAYADDTPIEQFRRERAEGIESKNRNNTVEKNFQMWEEMKKGTEYGRTCCIRAKIDMKSQNFTLRDPVLYRCKLEKHNRTGDKYNVYPTYDFCCPIVDSIEGVTHACRTSEYNDRNAQYYWIIDALGIRKPYIFDFSRLNVTYTVMSKRKLTWFVEQGIAEGWDDPRFPTLRGLFRRGLTLEALQSFIVAQGASKSSATIEIETLWAMNKKIIDPIVPRYHAVHKKDPAKLHIDVGPEQLELRENPLHAQNKSLGKYKKYYYKTIYIEQDDAKEIKQNEEVTLRYWGNAIIKDIKVQDGVVVELFGEFNPKGSPKTTQKKLTWLAVTDELASLRCLYYAHLITKKKLEPEDDFEKFVNPTSKVETIAFGDHNLKNLKKGDKLQLERWPSGGYFIVDKPYNKEQPDEPIVLISIPEGKGE